MNRQEIDRVKQGVAAARKAKSSGKFPTSMKELRRKYPNGAIVRAHFTTPAGQPVTYEGVLNEQFFQVARAVFDVVEAN